MGEAVFGAVDEGDEGGDAVEDAAHGERVDGGQVGDGVEGVPLAARSVTVSSVAVRAVPVAVAHSGGPLVGEASVGREGGLSAAGRGHGAVAPPVGGDRLGPGCGATLCSGEPGAPPAREVHESLPRVVVVGRLRYPAWAPSGTAETSRTSGASGAARM
ncbi:hypothetical protein GCM10020256_40890 [Streptomyces thermocoprophilus]